MTLAAGARLGPYDVVAPLGAGGMGEVYRAHDARLGRDVAIKVLPAGFSADQERLQRFEQEARAAAALNHPNILAVYDVGQHDGSPYVVSELLEGQTLRDRLNGGALPARRAVEYAVQGAQGLAAAHGKGIVHRDLKPENLFITTDDRVKILDFGLAKLTEPHSSQAGASALSTTPQHTQAGVLLGTIGYMAPEQVRGLAADHRSDIFAFGAVIYEMVSGQRAFRGDTAMDTMTAILKEDPPDLPVVRQQSLSSLERVIRRCLEKNPAARFQSAGDLVFALEGVSGSGPVEEPKTIAFRARGNPWRWISAASVAVALLALGTLAYISQRTGPTPATVRFAFNVLEGRRFDQAMANLAFSPDGSRLVYQAVDERGLSALYVRTIDSLDSRLLAGTERGWAPFFSPDGQWIGFFANNKLKKISIVGGVAIDLADAPNPRGGSWGTDDTIVFTPTTPSGVVRVPASGGTPTPVTTPDPKNALARHNWPELLPGANALLFSENTGGDWADADIVAVSLGSGERRVLVENGSHARYSSTGHLVFTRSGSLLAIPFDVVRLEITGEAIPVVKEVRHNLVNGGAQFAVSGNGALAYVPGTLGREARTLVWVDRKGLTRPAGTHSAQPYYTVSLSPDGRRLALSVGATLQGDVWAYDLDRDVLTPLTLDSRSSSGIWTADAKRTIYWKGDLASPGGLFWRAADGSGAEEQLYAYERVALLGQTALGSWAPDGRELVLTIGDTETEADIWTFLLDNRQAKPLVRTPFVEQHPALSPDGRWLAYSSTRSGRAEIYVQPYPELTSLWTISADGGTEPMWARNGRELFYRSGTKMMAVDVETEPVFRPRSARVLFERPDMAAGPGSYDVSANGQEFIMIKQDESAKPATEAHVVLGWAEELRRPAP